MHMHERRRSAGLAVLSLALVPLLSAGCSQGDADGPPPEAAATSAAVPSAEPPVTERGAEDEAPPPDAGFPASVSDDSGAGLPGSSTDPEGSTVVAGIRLLPQNGYDRVVVDLDTAGTPAWTARYSTEATAAGDPVPVAGESFLRLGLYTENSSAEPVAAVLAQAGLVAEVRSTGSLGGYQEVLVGVRGAPAPFRAFALTDPGRLVVDIRPAG
jgi:hypothetical protein